MRKSKMMFVLIFFVGLACKKDNTGTGTPCDCPQPPVVEPLFVSFWDSTNNHAFFTSSPDSALSYYYVDNQNNSHPVHLSQVSEPIKYRNKLELSTAAGTILQEHIKTFYLKFSNGDIDTLFLDYGIDEAKNRIPLLGFEYNHHAPTKESSSGLYIIDKRNNP